MVVHSIIPATWEAKTGGSWFKVSLGKISTRPSLKNKLNKRNRGVVQEVELSQGPEFTTGKKIAKSQVRTQNIYGTLRAVSDLLNRVKLHKIR
jgi:hypothetical protein